MDKSGTAKKRGLGKGLGALIVNTQAQPPLETAEALPGHESVQMVAVDAIRPNPRQPRSHFDEGALQELAASIREHGIIQPLIVTRAPDEPDRYWLIAGERRWRAARLAQLAEVPAILREATPQQLMEWALVENVQRADLNPLEEATAYQVLMEEFHLTQAEIAERVGKSRSAIANSIRLLQLPVPVQQALIDEKISAGHARALLALPDPPTMLQALEQVVSRGLNVRQTEQLVRQVLTRAEPDPTPDTPEDPWREMLAHLENRFRAALGTRVHLNRNPDGTGKLVVHFYSDEDLDHLYRVIAGAEE
ncbi:MAG: chromosome partitioning protein ParB [Litorilinea sp.]|nr:MAG: chromosome partitioning protein ParB [Litorilinea sp.]